MTRELDAAVRELWLRFAPAARSRVDVLERYAAAVRAGAVDPPLREEALACAHKLSGALGSYHRPGSAEGSRIERLIEAGDGSPDELDALVRVLRAAVTDDGADAAGGAGGAP